MTPDSTAPAIAQPGGDAWPAGPLRVVVLTCYDSDPHRAHEAAGAIAPLPGVEVVAVAISAPRRPRGLRARLRQAYRRRGFRGVLDLIDQKSARLVWGALLRRRAAAEPKPASAVPELRLGDFHADESLAALRALRPDLAVVDGTYILKESVFGLPRLGSINLHCGKLPEYRGAPPAFWELYHGEREVGVTVHRVTAGVDQGPILRQEVVPFDPAPAGDPMEVVEATWRDVLRPIGIRLLAESVAAIASGRVEERPQNLGKGETYRFPDHLTVQELRDRVRARRAQDS